MTKKTELQKAAAALGQPDSIAAKDNGADTPKAPPPKSAKYVTVACKIPAGLVLQLCEKTTFTEDTPAGPRERVRYDRVGKTVSIIGPAYPAGNPPPGFPERPRMAGGFALTPGVDADFFAEWMQQNRLSDFVTQGMIFAHASTSAAIAAAREHRPIASGLEPLSMDEKVKDPRMPRPMNSSIERLKTADENASVFDAELEDA